MTSSRFFFDSLRSWWNDQNRVGKLPGYPLDWTCIEVEPANFQHPNKYHNFEWWNEQGSAQMGESLLTCWDFDMWCTPLIPLVKQADLWVLSPWPAWSIEWVRGQTRLHKKNPVSKTKTFTCVKLLHKFKNIYGTYRYLKFHKKVIIPTKEKVAIF